MTKQNYIKLCLGIPNGINNDNTTNSGNGGGSSHAKGMNLKCLVLCFLSALLSWAIPTNTWGDTTTIDGVIYNLNDADSTASITGRTDDLPESVSIRGTVTYSDKTYTVTSIGDQSFCRCSSLTSIEVPAGVTSIGEYAFSCCSSLTTIAFAEGSQLETIGNGAFSWSTSLTTVTFAEGSQLETIGEYAFNYCLGLISIEIPASVNSIGNSAFAYCESLMKIDVATGNSHYCSENGILYNKEKSEILCYPAGKSDTFSFTIPAGVTNIGTGAFCECSSLTSVEIPASVISVGSNAFAYCESLKTVTFAEGCKLETIGDGAFWFCSSLASIEVPTGVTGIGFWAFYRCESLEKVVFLGDQPKASGIFYETPKLSCVYFLKGKAGWIDGGTWCSKTTKVYTETPEIPEIHREIQDNKLILTFTGTLESSTDGKEWISIDASSPYTVEMTGQGMLFRAVSK